MSDRPHPPPPLLCPKPNHLPFSSPSPPTLSQIMLLWVLWAPWCPSLLVLSITYCQQTQELPIDKLRTLLFAPALLSSPFCFSSSLTLLYSRLSRLLTALSSLPLCPSLCMPVTIDLKPFPTNHGRQLPEFFCIVKTLRLIY